MLIELKQKDRCVHIIFEDRVLEGLFVCESIFTRAKIYNAFKAFTKENSVGKTTFIC